MFTSSPFEVFVFAVEIHPDFHSMLIVSIQLNSAIHDSEIKFCLFQSEINAGLSLSALFVRFLENKIGRSAPNQFVRPHGDVTVHK